MTDVSQAALRMFRYVAGEWELSDKQARDLLGADPDAEVELSADAKKRCAYVAGLHETLISFFSDPLDREWVMLANKDELFEGRTPLEYMIQHGMAGIERVYRLVRENMEKL